MKRPRERHKTEPDEQTLRAMDRDRVRDYLRSRVTCPLWPATGVLLGLSRAATYRAAVAGSIHTLSCGRRRLVPTAYLSDLLLLDDVKRDS